MAQLTLFESDQNSSEDGVQLPKLVPELEASDWYIPPEIIVAAIEVMGAIDLDPCSDGKAGIPNVPAKVHYAPEDDGLSLPWGPKRRVFLIPPAARTTGKWVNKLCDEYEEGNITEGITLLRAVVDSDWWQRLTAYPVCFVHRRLRFGGSARAARFPSAVVYLGPNMPTFTEAFSPLGTVYVSYKRKELPSLPEVFQHGRYVVTLNRTACYVTIANSTWNSQDITQEQHRLRDAIMEIPEIMPNRFNSISTSREGVVRLVFSFKAGEADRVLSQIEALLSVSRKKANTPPGKRR
jgi:DNA N-6-adenine-methyltransferase (Dam)